MKTRLIYALLAFAMCAGMIGIPAFAAETDGPHAELPSGAPAEEEELPEEDEPESDSEEPAYGICDTYGHSFEWLYVCGGVTYTQEQWCGWNGYESAYDAMTCENSTYAEKNVCSVCGYVESEQSISRPLNDLKHEYIEIDTWNSHIDGAHACSGEDWESIKSTLTCQDTYEEQYSCEHCAYSYTVSGRGAHDYECTFGCVGQFYSEEEWNEFRSELPCGTPYQSISVCSVCGDQAVCTLIVEHEYEPTEVECSGTVYTAEEFFGPDCTEDSEPLSWVPCNSSYTVTSVCTHCGEKETKTGKVADHHCRTFEFAAPTLWREGHYAYMKCLRCGRMTAMDLYTEVTLEDVTIPRLSPDLPRVTLNTGTIPSSVTVKWEKASEAKGYYIYRREEGGAWGTPVFVNPLSYNSTLTYTDTAGLQNGKTYYYAVSAWNGTEESGHDAVGASVTYTTPTVLAPAAPKLKSAVLGAGGITVKWDKVSGATGYTVYRKTAGGSWSVIGTGTGTSYVDSSAKKSGKTYYYTVSASNAYGSGAYNTTGVSAKYVGKPVLTGAENSGDGIKVEWTAVSGATEYIILRRTAGGTWGRAGTASGTSFTDTAELKNGTTYYYTVRATNGSTAGSYDYTGVPVQNISAPKLISAEKDGSKVIVTWEAVSSTASSASARTTGSRTVRTPLYAVYRRTDGGEWKMLGVSTVTSYEDSGRGMTSGTTYYYTVRVFKDGIHGCYDDTGLTVAY